MKHGDKPTVLVPDETLVITYSEVRQRYAEGATILDLATEYGCSQSTVRQALLKSIVRQQDTQPKCPDERTEAMAKLRKGGQTYEQIAQVYGVTREFVRQQLVRYQSLTGETGLVGLQKKKKEPTRFCPNCSAPVTKPGSTHCSKECYMAAVEERNRPIFEKIVTLRKQGATWVQCARAIGWDGSGRGTSLQGWFANSRYARSLSPEDEAIVFPTRAGKQNRARISEELTNAAS